MAKLSIERMLVIANGPPSGFVIEHLPPIAEIPEPVVTIVGWKDGSRMIVMLTLDEAVASGVSLIQAAQRARVAFDESRKVSTEDKCTGSLEANSVKIVRS